MSFITSIQEITICASKQLQTKYLCLKISQYNLIKKQEFNIFWGVGGREQGRGKNDMLCST